MDRLAIVLAVISGLCIAGAALIAALALGFYTWISIAVCVAVGAVLAWPTGRLISRRIKREDPNWNPRHKPGDFGVVPPADAPEN